MATGTVTYTATLSRSYLRNYYDERDEIYSMYNIVSYAEFHVDREGNFPNNGYKIQDIKIDFPVTNELSVPYRLKFTGYKNNNEKVNIGTIKYASSGRFNEGSKQAEVKLNKDVAYTDIQRIRIDTEGYGTVIISAGKFNMTIQYQETDPVVTAEKIKTPTVITGVKESKGIKGEARNTQIKVLIEGVDISKDVNQHLLGMTYIDNEEDATDDLQIRMHDKDGIWLKTWLNEIIQTAADARYSRSTSLVTSAIIKDNAKNYSPLMVSAYLTDMRSADEDLRNSALYAMRSDRESGREWEIIMLKKYLQLLGFYKDGKLDDSVSWELNHAIYSCMQSLGVKYDYYLNNYHWTALIEAVNGKVDKIHVLVYTALKEFDIYSAANENSAAVATVPKGAEVTITGKNGSWFIAEYAGLKGYLQKTNANLRFQSVKVQEYNKANIVTKGLNIQAGIILRTPDGKQMTLNCGEFTLDTVGASGPPSSVTLKATSVPYKGGVRTEKRDKAWSKYTLSKIGQEIAKRAGLGYLFDSEKNPTYSRVEQTQQTDLAFLMDLCHRAGCSLKVSNNQLIIFEQSRYEQMQEKISVSWMDGSYLSYNMNTQEGESHYDGCIVRYFDPKTNKVYTATVMAEDADTTKKEGNFLVVTNEPVSSNDEAKALAKAKLRLANKFEKRVTFTMLGNLNITSGMPMRVSGFGLFDGKYIIRQAKHDISNTGFTTQVTLRAIPDETASKGTLKDVTNDLAKQIATPVDPKDNTGTEFKTTNATGLYRDAASSRNRDVSNVVFGVPEDALLTILGKERDGVVKVATNGYIGSAAYKAKSGIGQAGYVRADAVERK